MRRVLFVALMSLGLLAPRLAYADADILGVIQDETGAVLPGVTVTALHVDTGLVRVVRTDAQGRYRIKLGGEINIERSASFFDSNFGGTFLFDTDRAFDPNDRSTYPTRYTIRTGDSTLDRDLNLYSFLVQDNWLQGDTNYRTDRNNFSPRIGFAWDPWNDGKTSIRGGVGLYYDQNFLNIQGYVYRFGVVPRTVDLRIDNPCYPDPSVTIPGVCGESVVPGAPTRSPTVSSGQERSPYALKPPSDSSGRSPRTWRCRWTSCGSEPTSDPSPSTSTRAARSPARWRATAPVPSARTRPGSTPTG
jgi:hypothetical protein